MTIFEAINKLTAGEVAGWGVVILILLLSLVQISPLKLNPWDKIFGWIGKKTQGEMRKQVNELQKQIRDLWINNHRQSILTFARECRADFYHDSEEWSNILNLCEEYERYTEENHVTNGVVRENTKYIRELYQKLSHEHKI